MTTTTTTTRSTSGARGGARASSSCSSSSSSSSWRTCLAIAGVCCFTVIQLYTLNDTTKSRLLSLECDFLNSPSGRNGHHHQQQEDDELNVTSPIAMTLESFAISFDPARVEKLKERNAHANLGNNTLWVPGIDGLHQRTLNLWAQLTKNKNPMTVEQASKLHKDDYQSPHAVGVYLAHWNLLRTLAHRHLSLSSLVLEQQQQESEKQKQWKQQQHQQQHAYLILEDDATCAPGLKEEIARVIQQLPSDWDLLFVGGKPFSHFEGSTSDADANANSNANNNNNNNQTTLFTPTSKNTTFGQQLIHEYFNKQYDAAIHQQIRHAICQGHYGKAGGPLAPDGSRRLSQDSHQQAYWQADYLTNTHAYVVNPQRVGHVAHLLRPKHNVPVDIRLADLMQSRKINAYMTTRMWCDQSSSSSSSSRDEPLAAPQPWRGYFAFRKPENRNDWNFIWQTQMHVDNDEFPDCAF